MASVTANGIRIEYEEFGDPSDPVILLIMGFGAQMVVWPESLCQALAGRSFRVIRFDNRDAGLSTHLDGVKAPGMRRSMVAGILGIKMRVPYTLGDMASDTQGLLAALGIRSAHVVGASMGGMIAQILAARHGECVTSLTSMMSTSGSRSVPPPQGRILRHILFRHRKNMSRDATIDYLVDFHGLIASPVYKTPPEEVRRRITSWVDRSNDHAAIIRQFAAMTADGDRADLLGTIVRPTLVIHGSADPLIPVAGGQHTAECIPNARLHVIDGMAHDLPEQLVPELAGVIAAHCAAEVGAGR